ncbi:hypothetical protein [uncultured Ruegeria sp.]|uniref:hypothetical protein n=1 Tax=uncultured Ruegeria sp. TaxID=259304 RepID=UPI002623C043|nr:hypothetical protein [uncultured Ruegeria sp.]
MTHAEIAVLDCQLWEVDENLMRAELTPTQMGEHLVKRKELWEARELAGNLSRNPKVVGLGNLLPKQQSWGA